MHKASFAFIGMLIGAGVDLVVNLLAAAIQQQAFADQFSQHSIWWLVGLALAGLFLGYWLGSEVSLPSASVSGSSSIASDEPKIVTVTRLKALLSYIRLRGRGIHLSDILLVGSRIDLDTSD